MRTETKTINIYTFSELSPSAQEHAITQQGEFNASNEWWDYTYDDAENIGLKITGFDLDRSSYCEGHFILSACEVAANIFRDHGETCETYKTAEQFMGQWQPVFNSYTDESSEHYESRESEDKLQELEDEFLKSLLEDYQIMLQNEYEYQFDETRCIEDIKANEYEFTEDGEIY